MEDKLEYEDGYIPPNTYSVNMYMLKTPKSLKDLIGKTIKKITYYNSTVLIIFTDSTELEIDAEECFDFHIIINGEEK